MNKILLYVNLQKDKKLSKTYEIANTLISIGYKIYIMLNESEYDTFEYVRNIDEKITFLKNREDIEAKEIDLVVVIGGDGSIIGYCRNFRDIDVPVIGLNLGTFGFLTELSMGNYERIFRDYKEGKIGCTIQERSGLYIEYEGVDEKRLFAVNDVTLARGVRARIVEIEVYINGNYLDTYNADGMLVATATGSTAYNLSAGGPILFPASSDIVITPICPHSLSARSIVITKDDIVTLKMISEAREGEEKAFLTVDGQEMYPLQTDSTVNIKCRNKKIKYLLFDEEVFYRKLREKIK